MNGIPNAILHFPDGTVVKCEGVFISADYAAALAKLRRAPPPENESGGKLEQGDT